MRGVFVAETLRAFQFDYQHIFYENISKIVSDSLALVRYRKWRFDRGPDASQMEFRE
jgi:hypothetical protein